MESPADSFLTSCSSAFEQLAGAQSFPRSFINIIPLPATFRKAPHQNARAKEMAMATRLISKSDWRPYLDQISKELVGRRAEVDVVSLKLGSQVQAQWVQLLGIAYDPRNDVLEVALEGLDHLIPRPLELYVDEGRTGVESLSISDADGNRHIIRLKQPVIL
jgi:hypothetical protein